MIPWHQSFIRDNYGRLTPLEIAEHLGLEFRRVTQFIDKNKLEPHKFFVAPAVKKATLDDVYWKPE